MAHAPHTPRSVPGCPGTIAGTRIARRLDGAKCDPLMFGAPQKATGRTNFRSRSGERNGSKDLLSSKSRKPKKRKLRGGKRRTKSRSEDLLESGRRKARKRGGSRKRGKRSGRNGVLSWRRESETKETQKHKKNKQYERINARRARLTPHRRKRPFLENSTACQKSTPKKHPRRLKHRHSAGCGECWWFL
jgi:hypothetical protein